MNLRYLLISLIVAYLVYSCKTTTSSTQALTELSALNSEESFLNWESRGMDQSSWNVKTSIEYWQYNKKEETCLVKGVACRTKTKLFSGEKFTQEEKVMLKEAMDYLVERILSEEVIQCAKEASTIWMTIGKQYATKEDLLTDFKNNLKANFYSEPGVGPYNTIAFIPLKQHEDDLAKYASTAVGKIDQDGLSIIPNPNKLQIRISKKTFFTRSVKVRAALIAHEILHQLGHEHPKSYSRNKTLYFIDEFSDCIVEADPRKRYFPWIP